MPPVKKAFLDGEKVPEKALNVVNRISLRYEDVEQIVNLEKRKEGKWLRLQWVGFPEECNFTWARLKEISEDLTQMIPSSPRHTQKKKLAAKAARQLCILLQTICSCCTVHDGSVTSCHQFHNHKTRLLQSSVGQKGALLSQNGQWFSYLLTLPPPVKIKLQFPLTMNSSPCSAT